MATVLIVEDDQNLREALGENLRDEGYEVRLAATVAQGRERLSDGRVDVLVLDLMLPDGDGSTLARHVREAKLAARVLMLTARTLEDDVVRGFDAGADDYLAKPYRLRELLARIAALARRAPAPAPQPKSFTLGAFSVDEASRVVSGPQGPIELTRKEFDLLVLLWHERHRVLSREEMLDRVWGAEVVVDPHTVDNFISNLKKKLKARAPGFELRTVRGVGFQLRLDA